MPFDGGQIGSHSAERRRFSSN